MKQNTCDSQKPRGQEQQKKYKKLFKNLITAGIQVFNFWRKEKSTETNITGLFLINLYFEALCVY